MIPPSPLSSVAHSQTMTQTPAVVLHRSANYSYCYSYSQPGGKWRSGTALLLRCSTLALRTPLRVPSNNSFCLPTASLSTNSLYVLKRKVTSASLLHPGYMNMSRNF